jgi:hypothetical protein
MTFEKTALPEKSTFQPPLNVSEFGLWRLDTVFWKNSLPLPEGISAVALWGKS